MLTTASTGPAAPLHPMTVGFKTYREPKALFSNWLGMFSSKTLLGLTLTASRKKQTGIESFSIGREVMGEIRLEELWDPPLWCDVLGRGVSEW